MTEPVAMTTCPTDETLAAFIDGLLNDDARMRVIEHMADHAPCRDAVVAYTEFRLAERAETKGGASISRFTPRTWVTAVVVLAAAAVLFVLFGPLLRYRLITPPEIRELAEVSESLTTRPLDGRLTGGFAHQEAYRVTRDASPHLKDPSEQNVAFIVEDLTRKARKEPSPENLHALGIAQIYDHRHEAGRASLTAAILTETNEDELLAAIKKSRNSRLLTDLSAALQWQVADDRVNAMNRTLSYEAADAAWRLSQTEETAWNRAVAIEGIGQVTPAIQAWQDYRKLDSTSKWAAEAQRRINRLAGSPTTSELWDEAKPRFVRALRSGDRNAVAGIVKAYPMLTRMMGEDEIMASWATNHLEGRTNAAQSSLSSAKLIGSALANQFGESLLHDAVAIIEQTPNRSQLAHAHARYAKARVAYGNYRADLARTEFIAARDLFSGTRSPYQLLSGIYAASSLYYKNDYQGARQEIDTVLAEFPEPGRNRAAHATALWIRANSAAFLGRFADSITDYNAALDIFVPAGEQDNILAMREMLASAYEMVGDRAQAWSTRYAAFADLREVGRGSFRTAQTIGGGARAAKSHGYTAMASLLTDAEIASAELPQLKTAAYARRAVLSFSAGDEDDARSYAALAEQAANGIADRSIREFAQSDPEFVRAMCAGADTEARAEIIERALASTRGNGDELRSVELLLLLSAEHVARGNRSQATAALDRAVAIIDRQENALENIQWCDALLDERRSVYRDLITLLADEGHTHDALLQAERSRARTVRAGFSRVADTRTYSDLDGLRRGIAPTTAVVFYASSSDRLFTWLLTSDGARFFDTRLPVGWKAILRRLEASRTSNDFDAAVKEASQLLVKPWRASVSSDAQTIVFIPDDQTANVPFNALLDGASLLLARFQIMTSPSLALHIACVERDRQLRRGRGSTLVVAAGNARPDLGLEALPNADNEVRSLSERPGTTVLDQASATRRAFLQAAPSAQELHFTTHGVINPMRPSLSALVLQREADDDGLLYVHEIAKLHLPQTRMVVIAACSASRAGRTGREGTATIGRAFMAAGVPVVLSSTREIDDKITAEIVASFYRRVDAGADPVTALRLTQLSMKDRVPAVDWATMQIMGGIAETERE